MTVTQLKSVEPSSVATTAVETERYYQMRCAELREALRAADRGIKRLKRRIENMRKLELENEQLRRQVRAQKAAIKTLKS